MQNDPHYGHVPFVFCPFPCFVFSPLLSVLVSFLKCFVLFKNYNMAEEKIKNIIAAILERPEYLLDTPRNRSTRSTASELLESIKGESNQKIFNHFVIEFVRTSKLSQLYCLKYMQKKRYCPAFTS